MRNQFGKLKLLAGILFLILIASGCSIGKTNSLTVTFHENKCSYRGPTSVDSGKIRVTMVVDKKAHDAGLVVLTLAEGKTIADLQALPPNANQPLWSHRVGEAAHHVHPGERYSFDFTTDTGPIYLVCFAGPSPDLGIGAIGPIEVKK